MTRSAEVSLYVQTPCVWEACARKVGNVHNHRDFAGTSLTDFLLSAAAIGPAFAEEKTVGKIVLRAVEATRAAVGQNTNLGIVLALAPLYCCKTDCPLEDDIGRVLSELTVDDATDVYRAIRMANPGGLGSTNDQDASDEPTVTLREAMRLAADRDQIARLYATDFRDIFDFGLPRFAEAWKRFGRIEPAIIDLQLHWLAREPDTLIDRKNGLAVALDVSRRAEEVLAVGGLESEEGRARGRELDAYLRSDGNRLNPGTTADLVAAVLFAALRERIVTVGDRFPWDVEDWL